MKEIQPYYAEYTLWEDYNNGMYDTIVVNEEELINEAMLVLCNPKLFLTICYDVLKYWEIASKVNLTNVNSNRRAWLGQAACSYYKNVPETLTRKAWSQMSDLQRYQANCIADKIIKLFEMSYEKKDRKLYKEVDNYSLFE
jgi:hypothetical protein